jgi:hypothetical protein
LCDFFALYCIDNGQVHEGNNGDKAYSADPFGLAGSDFGLVLLLLHHQELLLFLLPFLLNFEPFFFLLSSLLLLFFFFEINSFLLLVFLFELYLQQPLTLCLFLDILSSQRLLVA